MQLQHTQELARTAPHRAAELSAHEEAVRKTPEANRIHGMYVVGLRQLLEAEGIQGHGLEDVQRFRYYPLRNYMQLLLDSATTLYPNSVTREGLRMLGRLVIPTFANSLAGKVLMSVVGNNWELGLNCLARGYQVSLRPGKASVVESLRGRARVELRDVWNFGDSYQVGVIEGLMHWCQLDGHVVPHVLSPCDTDLVIQWTMN
jgi:uncharacterized protein (TIGR02265 family)